MNNPATTLPATTLVLFTAKRLPQRTGSFVAFRRRTDGKVGFLRNVTDPAIAAMEPGQRVVVELIAEQPKYWVGQAQLATQAQQ